MTSSPFRHRTGRVRRVLRRQAQRGVTLLFALITLVALLFATLALVRSVDTSTILMGNIGFKQDATVTADQATKVALSWLSTHGTVLNSDSLVLGQGQGYYASTKEFDSTNASLGKPVDATGQQVTDTLNRQVVDWSKDSCGSGTDYPATLCSFAVPADKITGSNSARYVIFRLCSLPGDYTSSTYAGSCAKWNTGGGGGANGSHGGMSYAGGGPTSTASTSPYYRIVVRVQGARNTTSFTETIVHY
jgi:uncharacterized membrane protein YgcG